jgi:hypothetical protein
MGVSCIVDFIAGKMGLVGEQNVTNHMGVKINPMAQFQPATHVRRFKMLHALNVVTPIYGIMKIVAVQRIGHHGHWI